MPGAAAAGICFEEFGFGFRPARRPTGIAASVWPLPGWTASYFNEFALRQGRSARDHRESDPAGGNGGVRGCGSGSAERRLAAARRRFPEGRGRALCGENPSRRRCASACRICRMERYEARRQTIVAAADRLALFPHAGGHAAALVARRLADRPLRAAEGGARLPRLQRPDHPHGAPFVPRRCRPLGTVQA